MEAKRWITLAAVAMISSTAFATSNVGCDKDDWRRYGATHCGQEQPAPQPAPAPKQDQSQQQAVKQGQNIDFASSPVGVGQGYGGEGGAGGQGVGISDSKASASVKDVKAEGGLGVGQGYGGAGGQGVGISDSASKAKSDSAASVKDVKAEGGAANAGAQAGGATLGDVGNSTITDNSRYLSFVPVQVAPLPPTVAAGGVQLQALGKCGPRYVIRPFARQTYTPQIFGLFNSSAAVETMHGTVEGMDAEHPFVYRTIDLPAPFEKRIVYAIGHQIYITAGSDGQGGGSSGAGNYASERAFGIGASLNTNHAFGVVGVVAVPCEYSVMEASMKPAPIVVPPPPPAQVKPPKG